MSLLALPIEMQLLVLERIDSLADLARLSAVSRAVRRLVASPAAADALRHAILPRAVPCLRLALDYVAVLCPCLGQPDDTKLVEPHMLALLHDVGTEANAAADVYAETCHDQFSLSGGLSMRRACASTNRSSTVEWDQYAFEQAEREHFTRALYRLRILAATQAAARESRLARLELSAGDVYRLRDVAMWAAAVASDMRKWRAGLVGPAWISGSSLRNLVAGSVHHVVRSIMSSSPRLSEQDVGALPPCLQPLHGRAWGEMEWAVPLSAYEDELAPYLEGL